KYSLLLSLRLMAHERRRDLVRFDESLDRASMMFQPCFLAVRGEGANKREVHRTLQRSKAAGDFLTKLHHAPVAFGLIIGERNGWIAKETQRVFFALCEPQEEIVSGSARRTTAAFAGSVDHGARQRHLGLMEGQPFSRQDKSR